MTDDLGDVTWTRLSECSSGKTCPRIGRTGRGTVLVQGYPASADQAAALGVPEGEWVVEVPDRLLPEV